MTEKTTMVGTLRAQAGKGDEMEAVLARMIEAAGDEPGVEIYTYLRGEGDDFWFFALMSDEASIQGHGRTEAMQAVMADVAPLMAEPPQMQMTRPVGAIGFEL